jgi:hypothetical protein
LHYDALVRAKQYSPEALAASLDTFLSQVRASSKSRVRGSSKNHVRASSRATG